MNDRADTQQRRIECRRQMGRVFDSTIDLKWLYFSLALNVGLDRHATEQNLKGFVREPIWALLWGQYDELVRQAAHYIDCPLYHCTALRDFFIANLIDSLSAHVRDPVKDRLVLAARWVVAVVLILLAFAFYAFVNSWVAAAIFLILVIKSWGWFKEVDKMQICKYRNACTRNKIREMADIVRRGGFDEVTAIRKLEHLDVNIPPAPKLIHIYACPYLLGSDPTGLQDHTIPVPDVLYALLRLPRRNAENEICHTVFGLSEERRNELECRWRAFVSKLAAYDEASPGTRH